MSSKTFTLDLPDELAQALQAANETFLVEVIEQELRSLKIDQALTQYARGGISFGAAARHAYTCGMEPPCSAETLEEELRPLR